MILTSLRPKEMIKLLILFAFAFYKAFALNSACVTTGAINAAFQAAQLQTQFTSISSNPSEYELGQLGRTLEAATTILAQKCALTRSDIFAGLSALDTSNTVINSFCPVDFKTYQCDVTRYRSPDGYCNNLNSSFWGGVYAPYKRLLPPAYFDAISAPRRSITGNELPNTRKISLAVHKNQGPTDQALTVHFVSWGQFIDHDMVETIYSTDSSGTDLVCCDTSNPPQACYPISVSSTDPFFSQYGISCLDFSRSAPSPKQGCRLGVRNQFSRKTTYLDASMVYGNDVDETTSLRSFSGGLLRTQAVFQTQGLKDLPPLKTELPDEDCFRTSTSTFCFLTGDSRSNQQPMLSAPHTIFMREHNRIAKALQQINPTWSDEKLFQETRHIIAAVVQKITYDEYLPLLLGKDSMKRFGLELLQSGYYNGYDPNVDATLPDAFNAAAYRFAHSMVPSTIQRWSNTHQYIGSQNFSSIFYQPWYLNKPGYVDQYLLGMMNQIAQKTDNVITDQLTNHLEQEPADQFGTDLAARNIQRGRDHGIPSYNQFRIYCGLTPVRQWSDLAGILNNETIAAYSQLYASPEDVDLWSAGVSEFPLPGSAVGPTFNCIIGQTFRNLRNGDRFWFENGLKPSSFTPDQLAEIRKVKYARIICDNGDAIDTVQMNVMLLPDPNTNLRVACKNSILPSMDLTKWKAL